MKKLYIFAFVAMLFAACTTDETQDVAVNIEAPDTLVGTFEGDDSRIQLNEAQKTVWTKDDLVSVFYRSNANQKWQYQGETGERTGNLKRVANAEGTQELSNIVVVYPYNENYYINPKTNNVQASLPAVQTYLKDSYGLDGNIMVSQSEYNQFSLKNVCGWLKIQLTGNGEKVQSIKLKGNNGEQVAGEIYINSADATSTLASEMGSADDGENSAGGNLVFDDTILTEVVLNCGEGVELGAEPIAFYIGLPPQTFAHGLTIEIEDTNALKMTKSTDKEVVISRNTIQPMAAFGFEGEQPNNVILYMATAKVEPNSESQFGANIVSNIYENGKGVITFDGDVTLIGKLAFDGCRSLTSVTIPDSVTSIGNQAFFDCTSLTSVTIPDSVTSIGDWAFYCTSLTSVTIPDSVTSIASYAFCGCTSLTSVIIGNGVTSIGAAAFGTCRLLTSVTIGNGVTSIGAAAFASCTSLKEVYCKPTTPPTAVVESPTWDAFNHNASYRKIYVPRASVGAYKAANGWKDYASYIVGYDFENDEVKELSLAPTMSNVLNVPYTSTLCSILLKASVEYEVVIPSDASSWLYYNNSVTKNGDYDEVQVRAFLNASNAPRSATIMFKQVGGDLSTSITINQAYFEGVDDSALDTSKYLVYASNYSRETTGDLFDANIYIKNTYFTTSVSDVAVAEYKFQLPSAPTAEYSLSDDCIRVSSSGIEFYAEDDGYYFRNRHTWESLGVAPTDLITIRFDSINQRITVNGVTKNLSVEYVMGSYIFSSYYRDSDDGVYEEYGGFMEGAHLYYAKGWDTNGRLIYLGHASKDVNSSTGNIEACWESQSMYGNKKTFALKTSAEYTPLGIGNM